MTEVANAIAGTSLKMSILFMWPNHCLSISMFLSALVTSQIWYFVAFDNAACGIGGIME